MNDGSDKKGLLQDVLGALVFVAGAFLAVSLYMFWDAGESPQAGLTTRAVLAVIGAVGAPASFSLGIGAAVFGAAVFFAGRRVALARHGLGALGLFAAVVLLLGAASPGLGGAVGGALESMLGPGLVTRLLTALVGAFVLAVTVWSVWMPRGAKISTKLSEPAPTSAALREDDASGVSSAEAAALLPLSRDDEPVVPAHPIDVRLSGGVPEGAKPLSPSDVPASPSQPSPGSPSEGDEGRGDDPAAGVAAPLVGEHAEPAGEHLAPAPGRAAPDAPAARDAAKVEPESPPIVGGPGGAHSDPTVRVLDFSSGSSHPAGDVLRPSWETADEDEPVPVEAAPRAADPAEGDPAEGALEEEAEPGLPWPPDDERAAVAEAEVEDPAEEAAEVEEEALEPELQDAEAELDEEDEELDDEDDDEEEYDDEEYDEYEEYEDDDEEEEEDEDDDDEEYEDDPDAEYEELDEEDEDEEEYEDEDAEPEPAHAEAEEPDEPEVELEPAPRARSREPEPESALELPDDPEERVRVAGLLLIERERVAVSLFQREFGLDFKEATALLDELQERGLIGPYMGGRHRDILLTREEWLAQTAAS